MRKAKSLEKDPEAEKDWGQEKRAAEDEMVGTYHRLNGHEFEQAPGDDEEQGTIKLIECLSAFYYYHVLTILNHVTD